MVNKQEKILQKVAAHFNPNTVKEEITNQLTKNEASNHQAQVPSDRRYECESSNTTYTRANGRQLTRRDWDLIGKRSFPQNLGEYSFLMRNLDPYWQTYTPQQQRNRWTDYQVEHGRNYADAKAKIN